MKGITVRLSESLWEDFVRAFPANGERSQLIRTLIREAIKKREEKNSFEETVVREINSKYL